MCSMEETLPSRYPRNLLLGNCVFCINEIMNNDSITISVVLAVYARNIISVFQASETS